MGAIGETTELSILPELNNQIEFNQKEILAIFCKFKHFNLRMERCVTKESQKIIKLSFCAMLKQKTVWNFKQFGGSLYVMKIQSDILNTKFSGRFHNEKGLQTQS